MMIISAHADHRPSDYRFPRQRSDRLPLERSEPLTSPARLLMRALLLTLAIGAVMALSELLL